MPKAPIGALQREGTWNGRTLNNWHNKWQYRAEKDSAAKGAQKIEHKEIHSYSQNCKGQIVKPDMVKFDYTPGT